MIKPYIVEHHLRYEPEKTRLFGYEVDLVVRGWDGRDLRMPLPVISPSNNAFGATVQLDTESLLDTIADAQKQKDFQ